MVTINVTGRVSNEPKVSETKYGNTMLSFNIAADEYVNGNRETSWFHVCYITKAAQNLAKYLTKGKYVAVVGRESISNYINKKQEILIDRTIWANDMELLGNGGSSDSGVEMNNGVIETQPEEKLKTTNREDVYDTDNTILMVDSTMKFPNVTVNVADDDEDPLPF